MLNKTTKKAVKVEKARFLGTINLATLRNTCNLRKVLVVSDLPFLTGSEIRIPSYNLI